MLANTQDSEKADQETPLRFVATVNRAESARKLRKVFLELGGVGPSVQVRQATENVKSVAESDVVLLWSVRVPLALTETAFAGALTLFTAAMASGRTAANRRWQRKSSSRRACPKRSRASF